MITTKRAVAIAAVFIATFVGGVPAGATTTTTTAAAAPSPKPFGTLTCLPAYGIRLCQGGQRPTGKDLRVPSFDRVPLDADVALPATGKGPFPLVVLLHGLGGSKGTEESQMYDGGVDDVTLATQGFAVLMYTARGFGDSCGTATSRLHTPACKHGYIQLADQRYEIHDTQYLAGMLVDEGIARPGIGVSGVSYGGGQSLELAMLKNRIRQPTGALVPFVSPKKHIAMHVAAVYAMWPWDTLVTALGPNGHLATSTNTPAATDLQPPGIAKASWLKLLYGVTQKFNDAPVGTDPQSTLTGWYRQIKKGEPYTSTETRDLNIIQEYKSAIGIPMPAGGPAPTAIQSGWTDTLFPVSTALHYANRVTAAKTKTPMLLMFDDVGHGWAQSKAADITITNAHGISFLRSELIGHTTPSTGVVTIPQTCPKTAPSGPPTTGTSLAALQHGQLRISGAAAQTVTSAGGSSSIDKALNAAYTPTTAPLCHALPTTPDPGTAVYTQVVGSGGFSLLGAPKISATLKITGNYPELVGQLWDVSPAGTRQIVALGAYRPSILQASGTATSATATTKATFELNPNDYTFPAGDTAEFELVGSTPPLFRKSNGTFAISVTKATVTLPEG